MNESQSFFELSDDGYTDFRKKLLKKPKGSKTQRVFLECVRDTEAFIEHMNQLPMIGTEQAPIIQEKLTESEFKDPPQIIEKVLYKLWESVPPATACRTSFWAKVTLDHLRKGRIESPFLAANGSNQHGGLARLEKALADSSDSAPDLIDNCVRTVLRRLGGLREVRGNRSVYVDCPFARAWWRERWVRQSTQDDQHAKNLHNVLRTSQTYWEKFIDRIVFRNSTFGDENLRCAFLGALALFVRDNPKTKILSTDTFKRLCRRVSTYQGQRELSILDPGELDDLMMRIIGELDRILKRTVL